jgi:hypothetical protein
MSLTSLLAADLAQVLKDFDDCVWTPGVGGIKTVKCMLSVNSRTNLDEYTGVAGSTESCVLSAADVQGIARGDRLAISGVTYYVNSVSDEEFGALQIDLTRDEL